MRLRRRVREFSRNSYCPPRPHRNIRKAAARNDSQRKLGEHAMHASNQKSYRTHLAVDVPQQPDLPTPLRRVRKVDAEHINPEELRRRAAARPQYPPPSAFFLAAP